MWTVRNDAGVFLSAKSGDAKKTRRMVRVRHAKLVKHVEHRCLELSVAAALETRFSLLDARVFALMKIHSEETARLFRRLDHRVRVLERRGSRLRHDNVEARVQRRHRRRAMQVIRRIDLHCVKLGLRDQFLVVAESPVGRQARKVAKPVPILLVRVSDGADLQLRCETAAEVKVLVNLADDGARADDAETEFGFHDCCSVRWCRFVSRETLR